MMSCVSLNSSEPPRRQTPMPGASRPSMVMNGSRISTSSCSRIVPATRNFTMRGPFCSTAQRKEPSGGFFRSSSRRVTSMIFPPLPPRAKAPKPAAPSKARSWAFRANPVKQRMAEVMSRCIKGGLLVLALSVSPVIWMTALVSYGINPDAIGKLLVDDDIRKPVQTKSTFTGIAKECMLVRMFYDGAHSSLNSFFKGGSCLEGAFRVICNRVVQFLNGFWMENDGFHSSQIFATNLGKDFLCGDADHSTGVDFLRPSIEFLIPGLFISRIRLRRRFLNRVKQPGSQLCSVRSFERF